MSLLAAGMARQADATASLCREVVTEETWLALRVLRLSCIGRYAWQLFASKLYAIQAMRIVCVGLVLDGRGRVRCPAMAGMRLSFECKWLVGAQPALGNNSVAVFVPYYGRPNLVIQRAAQGVPDTGFAVVFPARQQSLLVSRPEKLLWIRG